jgi:hypothetical protein
MDYQTLLSVAQDEAHLGLAQGGIPKTLVRPEPHEL